MNSVSVLTGKIEYKRKEIEQGQIVVNRSTLPFEHYVFDRY